MFLKKLVRRYKFEIYPSPAQEMYLARIFGCTRFVYNEFLRINRGLREDGFHRLDRYEMQELLIVWKDALDWLGNSPSQSLQIATHDLDVAYQNSRSGRSRPPKAKKKKSRQSFHIPQPSFSKINKQFCIFLPNYKTWIPIRMHRTFPRGAKLGAATITKTPTGRYYVSIVTTFNSKEAIASEKKEILGVDLNIKSIVLSDGEKIETPQIIKTLEMRKRRLQKSMTRQEDSQIKALGHTRESLQKLPKKERSVIWRRIASKRSKNYEKNRISLAKIYEKIKFQKEDFLHKLALNLYRKNQAVAMETLNVKGMMKNRRLAKSIAFQSWGRLCEIMKMYAIQHDKQLHFISQWFPSSKMCHKCGFVNTELKLSDREWTCESCHTHHDRDINAAINIKNEGGSYPVHKPVERKGSVRRPKKRQSSMSSAKQESERLVAS